MKNTGEEILFIYGEWDPWSATAFEVYSPKQVKVVKPGGSHSTRIGNLPPEQQKLVIDKLEKWLEICIATN
jgi:hypothetical protein